MDIFTALPLDIASALDTGLTDAVALPLDAALHSLSDSVLPLPDTSGIAQAVTDLGIPAFDVVQDFGQMSADWSQPTTDWMSQQHDWSQQSSLDGAHPVMPRSSSDAEFYTKQAATATDNMNYHQKLADKYTADAEYYTNHGELGKAADNLGYAASEQAKVTSYQQDMQTALDKAKAANS
jgi:hypothetical protein